MSHSRPRTPDELAREEAEEMAARAKASKDAATLAGWARDLRAMVESLESGDVDVTRHAGPKLVRRLEVSASVFDRVAAAARQRTRGPRPDRRRRSRPPELQALASPGAAGGPEQLGDAALLDDRHSTESVPEGRPPEGSATEACGHWIRRGTWGAQTTTMAAREELEMIALEHGVTLRDADTVGLLAEWELERDRRYGQAGGGGALGDAERAGGTSIFERMAARGNARREQQLAEAAERAIGSGNR